MTRSEPPAEVIEDIVEKLAEEAKAWESTDDDYYGPMLREAIAVIESLRASSSLGGIEGGVARPQTACAPDEPLITGWLTIDSAPKDDTQVLIARQGEWSCQGYRNSDGQWFEFNNHDTDSWGGQLYPTHWQPLPSAP